METGKFLYKCRNCGKIYEASETSSYTNMLANFYSLKKTGKPFKFEGVFGNPPGLIDIHHCDDNTMAFADFVALKKYNDIDE